jgi:uncharacterized protein DUF3999
MKAVLLVALLCPAASLATERPQDFAYGAPIQIDGHEAWYEIELPASVYRGVMRRDLGDVRVFNAEGELVPFAPEPPRSRKSQPSVPVTVRFFPIYGSQRQPLDAVQLKVEKSSGSTVVSLASDPHKPVGPRVVVAYLIDAGLHTRPYEVLQLDWRQKTSSFAVNVRLDASDDLKSWSTVVARAPLVRVDYAGQRLEQRAIEFAPRTSRYLRVSKADAHSGQDAQADAQLELTSASLRAGEVALETPRSWMEVQASMGDNPGEYRFDLGGPYPVDRVRIGLVQDNTIATAELLVRATPADPWRSIARTVVYRLSRDGHQVMSPELAVPALSERYWLLRVDQRGGGLGTSMPTLYAGWIAQKIVFAARGNAPFQIAYGSARAVPAAYPIETLVPGWRDDARPTLPQAQSLPERLLGGTAVLQRPRERKVWALWIALLVGVAVLGWMAWRLARQIQAPPESTPATDASPS